MKNKNGFTLIELLIVVLIIGVLAGVAIPQYRLAAGKSKFATIKNVAKAIADAEERYYIANNKQYTTDFSALDVTKPSNAICGLWGGGKENNNIKAVRCCLYINKVNMCLYQYFLKDQPAGYTSGGRLCLVYSGNKKDIPNRICQSETGKKDGSGDSNYTSYWY